MKVTRVGGGREERRYTTKRKLRLGAAALRRLAASCLQIEIILSSVASFYLICNLLKLKHKKEKKKTLNWFSLFVLLSGISRLRRPPAPRSFCLKRFFFVLSLQLLLIKRHFCGDCPHALSLQGSYDYPTNELLFFFPGDFHFLAASVHQEGNS